MPSRSATGEPAPLQALEPLVHLDAAHLLERVDDGVLVGARATSRAPASCSRRAGPMPSARSRSVVGQKQAVARAAPSSSMSLVGQVGCVHRSRPRREQTLPRQQLGRRAAVEALAGEVLAGLLREVHVQRPVVLRRDVAHHRQVVARHGAHRVHGRTDPHGVVVRRAG